MTTMVMTTTTHQNRRRRKERTQDAPLIFTSKVKIGSQAFYDAGKATLIKQYGLSADDAESSAKSLPYKYGAYLHRDTSESVREHTINNSHRDPQRGSTKDAELCIYIM